jgi:hypothetical protein
MKRDYTLISASILLMIWLLIGCNSENKTPTDIELFEAKHALNELEIALNKDDGALWNYSMNGPVLLINKETRRVIANEADTSGILQHVDGVFVGYFPEDENIANSAIDWGGKRWTMVMTPLASDVSERLILLIHECFHRIQPFIKFDSIKEYQNNHLDTKEGRVLLQLEYEALKKALSAEESVNHIKNALLFRNYRYQIFEKAKVNENSVEINEGLAEYTGSILSVSNDEKLRRHYINKIEAFKGVPTFVRSFTYVSFPVYGYFLRNQDQLWNQNIDKNTNLTDLLNSKFNFDVNHFNEDSVLKVAEGYNYETTIAKEVKREEAHLRKIEQYKRVFTSDSVLELSLNQMNIVIDPMSMISLDSIGLIFPKARVVDDWGILEVDSFGTLINGSSKFLKLSLPIEINDSTIKGAGWNLFLNEGWKLEKLNSKVTVVLK